MAESIIEFQVDLDENKVPENINWQASDSGDKGTADAIMISMWDKNEKNTLKIDLWTKNMLVDEMKMLYHQTLLTMADTFEKATGETKMAREMRDFGQSFGEKMGLIKKG
jgi:gliding motility-associated protein GldC